MSLSDRLFVLYVGLGVIITLTNDPGVKRRMALWLVCLLPLIALLDVLSYFLKN